MAKFRGKQEKRGPVPHQVFTDRGLRLENANQSQQNTNINHGQSVVVDQDNDGDDILVKIGNRCPKCGKRVRGLNHASGDYHKGTFRRHTRH